MDDLIEALTILKRYQKPTYNPTTCEHDCLYVVGVDISLVTTADVRRLNELGFDFDEDLGSWHSSRFGSA